MMTKEDYMRLPKVRLAELLVERDKSVQPLIRIMPTDSPRLQCYEPGGTCTNSFRDCINCPKTFGSGCGTFTTTTLNPKDDER